MNHVQAVEPNRDAKASEQLVHARLGTHVIAGTPGVGGVQAVAVAFTRDARCRDGGVDGAQLLHRCTDAEASTRSVLQHEDGVRSPVADACEDRRDACGKAVDPRFRPIATMGADVDVQEPCPVGLGNGQLVDEHHHGPVSGLRLRAREVHEVGRVDGQGCHVVVGEAGQERRQLHGRRGSPAPRRGVVAEHLERGHANVRGPIGRLDHACAQGQVGTQPTSVGEHGGKGSGGGSGSRRTSPCATPCPGCSHRPPLARSGRSRRPCACRAPRRARSPR